MNYVYRAFDAAGRLLYVGCTVDLDARLRVHAENSSWWPFHDRIDTESFATSEAALEAEAFAILTEHPRWNIKGRSPEHPDGKASSTRSAPWLAYELSVVRRLRAAEAERKKLAAATRANAIALRTLRVEVEMVKTGVFSDADLNATT